MFTAVRQNKVPQQIIVQIRNLILEGTIAPGDKLASEKDLMEQFQVSKQTLREALRALEYMGLLEIRKGIAGGAYVSEVGMEVTREHLASFLHFKNLSIQNLSEVRKIIEPYAAETAAKRISAEEAEKFKELVELREKNPSSTFSSKMSEHEIEFHRFIAASTGNPILILMVDFIEDLLEDLKRILKPDAEFSKSVVRAHRRIYNAVVKRDPQKASSEMYKHIVEVEEQLIQREEKDNLWATLKT